MLSRCLSGNPSAAVNFDGCGVLRFAFSLGVGINKTPLANPETEKEGIEDISTPIGLISKHINILTLIIILKC